MNSRYHENEWRDAIASNVGSEYATGSRRADKPGASARHARRREYVARLQDWAALVAVAALMVAALMLAPWFFL